MRRGASQTASRNPPSAGPDAAMAPRITVTARRRFGTLTMPIPRADSPGIGWGDRAKPSVP